VRATGYRIVDEPVPSRLARLVVNPFWILLGLMLGGAGLGFPWFAFNAIAVGSASRGKELALAAAGLMGSLLLTYVGILLFDDGTLTREALPYAFTVLLVWKLGVGYALQISQTKSFQLYVYFGGTAKKGLILVVLASVLRVYAVARAGDFWGLSLL
jgi:hypothetical protein